MRQPPGWATVSRAARWWRSEAGVAPPGEPSGTSSSGPEARNARADSNSAHRVAAVRRVVGGGVQQAGEQHRAHHALLLAQRVGQAQRGRVVQPQAGERARGEKRVGHRLVEPAVAQHVLEAPAQPLAAA